MFKIINSSASSKIVEQLEEFGLYTALQPRASALMKTNSQFKKKYIEGFVLTPEIIQETKFLPGSSVISLIRDYLEITIDWSSASNDSYRDARSLARAFVLPINPPKIQIEKALRRIFRDHDIIVKKQRQGTVSERDKKPSKMKAPRKKKLS
jgi:poly(A) polymerase